MEASTIFTTTREPERPNQFHVTRRLTSFWHERFCATSRNKIIQTRRWTQRLPVRRPPDKHTAPFSRPHALLLNEPAAIKSRKKYPLPPSWLRIRYRMCISSSTPASLLQHSAPSVVLPTRYCGSSRWALFPCRFQWLHFWNTRMSCYGRIRFQDIPVPTFRDFSMTFALWRGIKRYFSHGVRHWPMPTMRFFLSWRSLLEPATSLHTTKRISLGQGLLDFGSFAPVNYSRRYRPCPH
jgi:hypothetical protein